MIEFDYLYIPISTKEYLHTGCRRGAVSLWTVGLQHEKLEICGDQRSLHVDGIGRLLMIDLRLWDLSLDVHFLMKYYLVSTTGAFACTMTTEMRSHCLSRHVDEHDDTTARAENNHAGG